MENVKIVVGTSTVGSEKKVDSGYSKSEWEKLSDEQMNEVINEKVWDVIYAYADNGEDN